MLKRWQWLSFFFVVLAMPTLVVAGSLEPIEQLGKIMYMEAVVQAVRDATYANLFLKVFGPGSLDNTQAAYNLIAQAIAAYERSPEVEKFASRFDQGRLTPREVQGLALFEVKCSTCHPVTSSDEGIPAMFTAHTYVNIGLPPNPMLALNPLDLGLGGFLEISDDPFGSFAHGPLANRKISLRQEAPLMAGAGYAYPSGRLNFPGHLFKW